MDQRKDYTKIQKKYLKEESVGTLHTHVQNVSCTQLLGLTMTHNRHTPDKIRNIFMKVHHHQSST